MVENDRNREKETCEQGKLEQGKECFRDGKGHQRNLGMGCGNQIDVKVHCIEVMKHILGKRENDYPYDNKNNDASEDGLP